MSSEVTQDSHLEALAGARTWQEESAIRKLLRSHFPDDAAVSQALNLTLGEAGLGPLPVEVIERKPNPWRSTFASEIVACRFADGSTHRVLCKYGINQYVSGHGHRGGVELEADVYERILSPLRAGARYFGAYEPGADQRWIVLEFLDPAPRLDQAKSDPLPLILAARWAGKFHAANEKRLNDAGRPKLTTYNAQYYAGWASRTLEYARAWEDCPTWLSGVCHRSGEAFEMLLGASQTVIHGEYTPHNVLIYDSQAYPIDWESAAIGPGEIDIASLTDCWPEEDTQAALHEYKKARWGDQAPPDFDLTVTAARLYWALRWMGNRPEWTLLPKNRFRFDQIIDAGRRLGLAPEEPA